MNYNKILDSEQVNYSKLHIRARTSCTKENQKVPHHKTPFSLLVTTPLPDRWKQRSTWCFVVGKCPIHADSHRQMWQSIQKVVVKKMVVEKKVGTRTIHPLQPIYQFSPGNLHSISSTTRVAIFDAVPCCPYIQWWKGNNTIVPTVIRGVDQREHLGEGEEWKWQSSGWLH